MELLSIRIYLSVFMVLVALNLTAQLELQLERKISARTNSFRVDPIGYPIFYEKDAIYKMDTTGNLMFQQSLKAYGDITDVDVISPMKYLIFFREQQVIGFFDNTFTPIQSRTRLPELDVSYATLVCYSMQFDRFWVYDQDNSTLLLFNRDGRKTLETENLNGLIGLNEPIQMMERFGNLYLVDENRGVYIFDMFGSLVNFIEIPKIQWVQVNANNLFYVLDNTIWVYNLRTKSKFKVPLSISIDARFQFVKGKMHFLNQHELHIFKAQ